MPQRMPCRQMPPLWFGNFDSGCSTIRGRVVSAAVIRATCGVQVVLTLVLEGLPLLVWYHATASCPLRPASDVAEMAAPCPWVRRSIFTGLLQCTPWSLDET